MQRSVLSSILILICAIATVHAQNLTTIDFALTPAPETEIAALATPQTAPPSPAPGQRVDEQVTGALTTASQTVGNVTGDRYIYLEYMGAYILSIPLAET